MIKCPVCNGDEFLRLVALNESKNESGEYVFEERGLECIKGCVTLSTEEIKKLLK